MGPPGIEVFNLVKVEEPENKHFLDLKNIPVLQGEIPEDKNK